MSNLHLKDVVLKMYLYFYFTYVCNRIQLYCIITNFPSVRIGTGVFFYANKDSQCDIYVNYFPKLKIPYLVCHIQDITLRNDLWIQRFHVDQLYLTNN